MNSQTAHLMASFQPQLLQNFYGLTSRNLRDKLLGMGYEKVVLDGVLFNQFCDGVDLWVEDDIMFLVDYYLYLEKILLVKTDYEHYAFLNDGLLQICAKSNGEIVDIKFDYCPGLDVANLITYITTITTAEYVWWWRNIAHDILNLTDVRITRN